MLPWENLWGNWFLPILWVGMLLVVLKDGLSVALLGILWAAPKVAWKVAPMAALKVSSKVAEWDDCWVVMMAA